jgi:biotin operon repressor|tara:strand:+ start:1479 stop:1667 length:189 start_codon:yes stop_codon:yes gene_type:complete
MKLYKKGRWTTKERQLLKENYNILSLDEISTRLMRTPSSITSQVNYLRKRGWTFNRRTDGSN